MKEVRTELMSLRESMNEVKAELMSLGQSIHQIEADQRSLWESMKEVKAGQKSLGQSIHRIEADQKSLWESMKVVEADQKSLGQSVNRVETDQKSLWESMKRVEANIAHIPEHLPPPAVVETNSPVRLSNFGMKISANLSVDKWAAEHAACLVDKASGKQEFEIFEMCVEYVAGQFDNDPNLNRYFRKGAYEIGTGVEQVKQVYEVELRDALLALQES